MPPVGFKPTISAGERPVAARLLRSWVRISPGAWIFVCCECRVLSGRGLCEELITCPEESYRLCCVFVCDLETSRMGAPYIYDISRLRVNIYPTECSVTIHISTDTHSVGKDTAQSLYLVDHASFINSFYFLSNLIHLYWFSIYVDFQFVLVSCYCYI
jgi:hypothetical protein